MACEEKRQRNSLDSKNDQKMLLFVLRGKSSRFGFLPFVQQQNLQFNLNLDFSWFSPEISEFKSKVQVLLKIQLFRINSLEICNFSRLSLFFA